MIKAKASAIANDSSLAGASVKEALETAALLGGLSPADQAKLDGIQAGATANSSDAALRDRATHTGVQAISTVTDLQTALDSKVGAVVGKGLSTEDYTTTEKSKLAGIAPGATANDTDAALRDRSTHTGTQLASTVSDFTAATQAVTAAQLVAGSNVTITPVGSTLVIASTGGGGGGGAPSGPAGGVLSGTYPNPGFAVDMATQGELDAGLATKVDTVMGKGLSTEDYTTTEKSKLAGVEAGATANSTDAALRDRSTHTGTQLSSTVSDFVEAAVDATAGALVAGNNMSIVYNDAANTITLASSGGGGSAPDFLLMTAGII